MRHKVLLLLAGLLFAELLVPKFAVGQRTEGQLSGRILDPSGAAIAGADLTLSQSSTGSTLTTSSNASGAYVFPTVPPGTYNLTVNAKGFARATLSEVVVYTARTTDLDVKVTV